MVDYRKYERVLLVIAFLLMLVVLYMVGTNVASCEGVAHAAPPSTSRWTLEPAAPAEVTAPKIEAAILWQTRNVPAHPVRRKPQWRGELVGFISTEAEKKDLPWALTTAVIYKESSFRPDAKGDYDENGKPQSIGLMQVGRGVQAKCRKAGLDLTDPHDQIRCGTWWFNSCWNRCKGNLEHAMAYYASGRVCRPDSKHLRDVVAARFRKAVKYQEVAAGVDQLIAQGPQAPQEGR
jgi:soluble lytic murein transglycosylase-like protein